MQEKIEISKDNLYDYYIKKSYTIKECMDLFGVSKSTIQRNIQKYDINKNSTGDESFKNKVYDIYGDEFTVIGEYKNSNTAILIQHKCGEILEFNPRSILKGRISCQKCTLHKLENSFKNKIRKIYKNEYMLSSEYINAHTDVEITHNVCGKTYNISPNNFFNEYGSCPHCRRGDTINKVVQSVSDTYYIDDYTDYKKYISVECKVCGHKFENSMQNIKRNKACPKCSNNGVSSDEILLREWIMTLGDFNITRYRDKKYELDIYIPEKNIGIEYNGNYWHSSINKDKKYHYNKSKYFEKMGIRIIHIYEYEWYNERQRPILENIIKNALGINENRIYARNCDIKVVESKHMKDFFNQNNIQGFRAGKFSICLFYKEEIIMAYQMGACFFGKGKYEWEVIRGATKLGYNVVGGASKIWKYFIDKYDPINCVYYIDYNYFNGSSLPYLGLKYIKTQPSFKNWWKKDNVVRNRQPSKHKEIKEAINNGEAYVIYNAGTKVYEWNKYF